MNVKNTNIEPGSLAEHLYNHYGLTDLEHLLESNTLNPLKRQWSLSDEQCKKQIKLAIQFIKRD